MGALDDLKAKAADLVEENRERIDKGMGAAADLVDAKTGHKYSDTIEKGRERLDAGLDKATGVDTSPPIQTPPDQTPPDQTPPPRA